MLLLSRFSHVRLCATPQTAAHQAPPSLGFSRQEHWSGLPFSSPMHESEQSKCSRSIVSSSSRPHGLQPTRLLHPWDFPGKSTGVACHCLLHEGVQQPSNFSPGNKHRSCFIWSHLLYNLIRKCLSITQLMSANFKYFKLHQICHLRNLKSFSQKTVVGSVVPITRHWK